jgi:hypothetical protein
MDIVSAFEGRKRIRKRKKLNSGRRKVYPRYQIRLPLSWL